MEDGVESGGFCMSLTSSMAQKTNWFLGTFSYFGVQEYSYFLELVMTVKKMVRLFTLFKYFTNIFMLIRSK